MFVGGSLFWSAVQVSGLSLGHFHTSFSLQAHPAFSRTPASGKGTRPHRWTYKKQQQKRYIRSNDFIHRQTGSCGAAEQTISPSDPSKRCLERQYRISAASSSSQWAPYPPNGESDPQLDPEAYSYPSVCSRKWQWKEEKGLWKTFNTVTQLWSEMGSWIPFYTRWVYWQASEEF